MADSKHRILRNRNREEVENQEGLVPTVRFHKIGANWAKLLKVKALFGTQEKWHFFKWWCAEQGLS